MIKFINYYLALQGFGNVGDVGGRVISPAISHLQGAPSPTGFSHDNDYYLEIHKQIEIS